MIEAEDYTCPCCRQDVTTHWQMNPDGTNSGVISEPGVQLIGDCFYHTECWDKQIAEYPLCPKHT